MRDLIAAATRRRGEAGAAGVARNTNAFFTYVGTSQTVSSPRGKYVTVPGTQYDRPVLLMDAHLALEDVHDLVSAEDPGKGACRAVPEPCRHQRVR